jgi:hypothetical protein
MAQGFGLMATILIKRKEMRIVLHILMHIRVHIHTALTALVLNKILLSKRGRLRLNNFKAKPVSV